MAALITPDSSVVIAAFAGWSEFHDAAIEALGEVRDLVAHVQVETYSVLTRMPHPFRADPTMVARYLREDFSGRRMTLPEPESITLVDRLAGLDISGGAVYDALIAITASHHGRSLLSCDERAAPTYERLGVEVTFL